MRPVAEKVKATHQQNRKQGYREAFQELTHQNWK
jgi:hypothetical protein